MPNQGMPESWNREIRALAEIINKLVGRAEKIRDERARLIDLASKTRKGGRPKTADRASSKEAKAADRDVIKQGWQRSEADLRRLKANLQDFSGRVGTARNRLARSGGAETLPEIDELMVELGSRNAALQMIIGVINGQSLPKKKN